MYTYLIMQNPGHSRVYYELSTKLALAELKIASGRFNQACQEIKSRTLADIYYISFNVEERVNRDELFILSRLSFIFALFECTHINKHLMLKPVELPGTHYLDSKISQLMKYPGKTNELFTRMMIHVGLLSCSFDYGQRLNLLDPVAGKGTTLFEGAVCGYDVAGIDISKQSVHEACVFFKKFLEKEKYKHRVTKTKGSRKHKQDKADSQEFEFAATKDGYKDEGTRRKLTFVCGDTLKANRYYKKNSFHMIVGDLPYGIAHGNVSKQNSVSSSRNPVKLLSDCLPEWYKVLKKEGVLVLSWNTFLFTREKFAELLTQHNFTVFSEAPYDEFEHRVDQSIKRDVIIAKK